ncbi:MAG TPA: DUF362 domain-containing protein, partial [Anaerolineae bacterium]|nr:DUF362 domain-containing protein [Anaerolineae bacterium]
MKSLVWERMHRIPAFTRRRFLKGAAGALGAALAWALRWRGAQPSQAQPSELTPRAYLPYIAAGEAARPRVAHVHHSGATHWDFQNDWYGEHVDQRSVDAMMDEGLKQLTGASSAGAAWGRLLPDYVPGQKIAIKVNFVNAGCEDGDNLIDALIEPVNALVGSLVAASVREQDITVYDASRPMPARFYGRRLYPGARYCDSDGCADERATFRLESQSLRVAFSYPGAQVQRWLTDVLRRAAYVVNMPILKRHAMHPVSLGFKNHFGSLNDLGGPEDDNPHTYITPSDSRYSADYSPLVDT